MEGSGVSSGRGKGGSFSLGSSGNGLELKITAVAPGEASEVGMGGSSTGFLLLGEGESRCCC